MRAKIERQRRDNNEEINGAQGRNRTTDTVIFSHVLYQLSYLGARVRPVGKSRAARERAGVIEAVAARVQNPASRWRCWRNV